MTLIEALPIIREEGLDYDAAVERAVELTGASKLSAQDFLGVALLGRRDHPSQEELDAEMEG